MIRKHKPLSADEAKEIERIDALINEAKEFDSKANEKEINRLYTLINKTSGTSAFNEHIPAIVKLVLRFMCKYKHTNYDSYDSLKKDLMERVFVEWQFDLFEDEIDKVMFSLAPKLVNQKPKKPSVEDEPIEPFEELPETKQPISDKELKQIGKEAREFYDKHEQEIQRIREGLEKTSGKVAAIVHLRSLNNLINQFMYEYKHVSYNNNEAWEWAIEKVITNFHIEVSDEELDSIVSTVSSSFKKKSSIQQQAKEQVKQIKHQEKHQYPPTYSTSKPFKPKDITTTSKPKLNLSHVQQVHQPDHVLPSENNRKLSVSSSSHHGRDNNVDYSFGLVEGIEADNRIYNSELKQYREGLKSIDEHKLISQLPKRTGIHSTNDARAAVNSLVKGRLGSWR